MKFFQGDKLNYLVKNKDKKCYFNKTKYLQKLLLYNILDSK